MLRRVLIGLGLLGYLHASNTCWADQALPRIVSENGVSKLVLPDALNQFIAEQFPGFHVPGKDDMTGSWASSTDQKVPYVCWGDFDGNGLVDVALILIAKNTWSTISFHQITPKHYEALPLEEYPTGPEEFTKSYAPQEYSIYTVPSGQRLVIQGKKVPETEHEHDSIAFFSLKDPQTGILYQWMPPGKPTRPEYRYGLYIASVFGALSD